MRVKTKLLLGLILLATVPMLVSTSIATWVAGDSSNSLLVAKTQETLVRIRDARKRQLETRFDRISQQITRFSRKPMVLNAMMDLEEGFVDYADEVTKLSVDEAQPQLAKYYRQLVPQRENLFTPDIAKLSDSAILIQYNYIVKNEFAIGEKQKLDMVVEATLYSQTHADVHPQFVQYLKENKIYDIYLVSPETREIVYSVKKEADLGAVLTDDRFARSEIGIAYAAVAAAKDQDFVYFSDFSPYAASEKQQSLFIATPIFFINDATGVLIFQYKADFVNRIMSNDGKWAQMGLGETGDSYIVGGDKTVRSELRQFTQDPQAYFTALQASGSDSRAADLIEADGTMIGHHRVDSISVERAQRGESGFARYEDRYGNYILSAYSPLELPGQNWSVMVEMTEREVHAPSDSLIQRLITYATATAFAMSVIAVFLGWLFTRRLVNPIEQLASEIDYIETNSDLSFRLTGKPSDITVQIVGSMNRMLLKIHTIVSKVAASSDTLSEAVTNIDLLCTQTYQGIEKQGNETNDIAAEIATMSDTVQQMAGNADAASQATGVASKHAISGQSAVDSTSQAVAKLSEEVSHAVTVIDNLAENSSTVSGVVDVISGIADQTNLLALNAAIEAARAGKLGRGFAVVADEVRTLASRTQESTEQIKKIVNTLKSCANDAVKAMSLGREQGEISVNRASQTRDALVNIVDSIGQVATLNQQIAGLSDQQRESTRQVDKRISVIREIAQTNTVAAEQTKNASNKINHLTTELKTAVAQFKLSG